MTKDKVEREWKDWQRKYLSKKERNNLSLAIFIDFLASKGYYDNPMLKDDWSNACEAIATAIESPKDE